MQDTAPGLAARSAAAHAVVDVLSLARSPEERVGAEFETRFAGLDARDRALARSIAAVSFRRLGTIRKALGRFLEKGLPQARRRAGMDPDRRGGAIVVSRRSRSRRRRSGGARDAARPGAAPFAALVNAVLRNLARGRKKSSRAPTRSTTTRRIGSPSAGAPITAKRRRAPSRRASRRADARPQRQERRRGLGAAARRRRPSTGSVRLETHAAIAELEATPRANGGFRTPPPRCRRGCSGRRGRAGRRSLRRPRRQERRTGDRGRDVTAVDRSAERLKRFAANFERLRLEAEIVVPNALTFEAPPFDATLLDAPCTATGTIRRHPDVAWTKRQGDLPALVELQSRLLDKAVALTKPGGTIVYCACSLEPEEGEGQIAALLRRNPDVARMPIEAAKSAASPSASTPPGELRTLPCHLPEPNAAALRPRRLLRRPAANGRP